MAAMTRMRVLGYLNPNADVPALFIVVLESPEGKIYYLWTDPFIMEAQAWDENKSKISQHNYIKEKTNLFIEISIEEPNEDNIFIAFSLDGSEAILFPLKDMYVHLEFVLKDKTLRDRDREIISRLYNEFWDNLPGKLICCNREMVLADDHGTATCSACGKVRDI